MNRDRRTQKRVVLYRADVPDAQEMYEVVYESVADALHFACRDLRTGRRRPIAIVEDGVMVLDSEGISAECEALEDADDLDEPEPEEAAEPGAQLDGR